MLVKRMLQDEGLTIAGAKRRLREMRAIAPASEPEPESTRAHTIRSICARTCSRSGATSTVCSKRSTRRDGPERQAADADAHRDGHRSVPSSVPLRPRLILASRVAVGEASCLPRPRRCMVPGCPLRVALVGAWRSLVSALDWGSRGRWFESSRPDQLFLGRGAQRAPRTVSLGHDHRPSAPPAHERRRRPRGRPARLRRSARTARARRRRRADANEQSATSHSITIDRPLRHVAARAGRALDRRHPGRLRLPRAVRVRASCRGAPDLVVSGINHGANLGTQRLLFRHRRRRARSRAARHPGDRVLAQRWSRCARGSLRTGARHGRAHARRRKPTGPRGAAQRQLAQSTRRAACASPASAATSTRSRSSRASIPAAASTSGSAARSSTTATSRGSDKKAVDEGYVSVTPLALEPTSTRSHDDGRARRGPRRPTGELSMTAERIEFIQSKIRDVPDFPKPGILFKDITPAARRSARVPLVPRPVRRALSRAHARRHRRHRVARLHLRRRARGAHAQSLRPRAQAGQAAVGRRTRSPTSSSTAPTRSRCTATRSRRASSVLSSTT